MLVIQGVRFNSYFSSPSSIRSLVYVFYITGGSRDLMPYILTLATTKRNKKVPILPFPL
jgi:hypothetical protein